jgi:hypothetical protein
MATKEGGVHVAKHIMGKKQTDSLCLVSLDLEAHNIIVSFGRYRPSGFYWTKSTQQKHVVYSLLLRTKHTCVCVCLVVHPVPKSHNFEMYQ